MGLRSSEALFHQSNRELFKPNKLCETLLKKLLELNYFLMSIDIVKIYICHPWTLFSVLMSTQWYEKETWLRNFWNFQLQTKVIQNDTNHSLLSLRAIQCVQNTTMFIRLSDYILHTTRGEHPLSHTATQ